MFFEVQSPWTGTVTVPNTTSALQYVSTHGGVPAGTWAVEVFDYAAGCQAPDCVVGDGTFTYPPGRYDVKALLRPGTTPASGTTDVTFYLVTDKLTAATAPANAAVLRMEKTLATYLGHAGIAVGTVSYVDMPASVKTRYAAGIDIDDQTACGPVATVLSLSGPGNALSLFLVNSLISSDGKYTYVGLDGTVPGPSSVGGTVASGALVSVADLAFSLTPASCQGAVDLLGCGADRTAYVAAHETGHFLGLYHVTEQNGVLFDPVQDTPTCPVATCAPGAQQVVTGNCLTVATNGCGGGDNLMFWLLDKTLSVGALSPQQSSIMRANPLVQ
jgi:hypothetical protein